VKQRDPNWRDIRRHHVVPDKRPALLQKIHEQEIANACPRCGTLLASVVEVHGHRQCSACGSVIEDCCQGECAYE
tara:strand:- start:8711 stop:8935 length:225 start_codon:yes stop_codon:yes gene_type:complete